MYICIYIYCLGTPPIRLRGKSGANAARAKAHTGGALGANSCGGGCT